MRDFDGCEPLCPLEIWNSGIRDEYHSNMFSGYAFYEQKKEDAVRAICDEYYRTGNTNFTVEVDSSLTAADLEEIQREVARRLG